ncbi:6-phosphogluconolactonase [Pelolinea submarina]|uniref:Glucosamine-6-phosphate deaminase n=1 Tax=Pelolinea submarina TaxID=913107 RepID=A0A347ZW73_9CHLR|nr:glucosamine-6-phosphate deaminase [Pelolinea submarina]REG07251.1 glucosamine-6-phosphate deaminase [Pelolinea submarina]BBB49554.1 glucosamine-6-phosphate deaminase [Pelolinea submarina]
MMQICRFETYEELSQAAAERVCAVLEQKQDAVLVLPTGNTPLGMFNELVKRFEDGEVSFKHAYLFELDEYYHGPSQTGPVLFQWLQEVFIDKVDFDPARVFSFDPHAPDAQQECDRIQAAMDKLGKVDLMVLGLGPNGHLAMNEPGTPFDVLTHPAELTPETLASNSAYWQEQGSVPSCGMTIGMGTIQDSGEILLMVNGASKRAILNEVLQVEPTPALPASMLNKTANTTVLADRSALEN